MCIFQKVVFFQQKKEEKKCIEIKKLLTIRGEMITDPATSVQSAPSLLVLSPLPTHLKVSLLSSGLSARISDSSISVFTGIITHVFSLT